MKAKQAAIPILACVALVGCSADDQAEFFGVCPVEEWYQAAGIQEAKGFEVIKVKEGTIVSGVTACSSGRTSVRAYGSNGKLVGVGDGFVNAGVFRVFVETREAINFDFRIKPQT